jgi:hypothetical protein
MPSLKNFLRADQCSLVRERVGSDHSVDILVLFAENEGAWRRLWNIAEI